MIDLSGVCTRTGRFGSVLGGHLIGPFSLQTCSIMLIFTPQLVLVLDKCFPKNFWKKNFFWYRKMFFAEVTFFFKKSRFFSKIQKFSKIFDIFENFIFFKNQPRVVRLPSYLAYMKYSWVASIARVSDQSDNFYFTFSWISGRGRTDSSCKMATERLIYIENRVWVPKIHLRVARWSSYFVHIKYPWVLSIARVSDQSYNFYKLFHDFQVSEGSSLAMKRLQNAWFTLKIKGFGSEISL